MSKILFIAPASNLDTSTELLRAAQRQEPTFCAGHVGRDKLQEYLRSEDDQYEIIHFAGHADLSILELSDGLIEVQDLINLLKPQRALQLVVITACNSARVGAELHNKRHIPVIVCQKPVTDEAAIKFSEIFYSTWRTTSDVERSVDVARATLAKRFPADADTIMLIDGDMATESEMSACMDYVTREIGAMNSKLESIEATVNDIKGHQNRLLLVVLILLLLAQLATPWLNHIFNTTH